MKTCRCGLTNDFKNQNLEVTDGIEPKPLLHFPTKGISEQADVMGALNVATMLLEAQSHLLSPARWTSGEPCV